MTIRNCFTASLLFCLLTAVVAAQGTPGGRTPILTGFVPVPEQKLQEGYVRVFDNISTFGWGENATIGTDGKLHFTGKIADTPFFYLGFDDIPSSVVSTTSSVVSAEDMVKPSGTMIPIFDGETLNGWTIRYRDPEDIRVAVVVENGTIKLTGGPGSLESVGKYGDFILQLEYRTDRRVNSGVFFRSIPGEVMNGYECQIFNVPGDRDYESFIGTDTGGIFRRQVGRNVGPQDGEWNYLTIVARGPRMSTWVNGIQVTDWTDEREPHANPRNGLRLEAGTIQFQGHDRGTEIWFRNIRILEL